MEILIEPFQNPAHTIPVVMMSIKPSIIATDLGKVRVRAHIEACGSLSELVNNILSVIQKPVNGITLAQVINARISSSDTPNEVGSPTKGRNTIYQSHKVDCSVNIAICD